MVFIFSFKLLTYTLNAVHSTLYSILMTNLIGQSVNWKIGQLVFGQLGNR